MSSCFATEAEAIAIHIRCMDILLGDGENGLVVRAAISRLDVRIAPQPPEHFGLGLPEINGQCHPENLHCTQAIEHPRALTWFAANEKLEVLANEDDERNEQDCGDTGRNTRFENACTDEPPLAEIPDET